MRQQTQTIFLTAIALLLLGNLVALLRPVEAKAMERICTGVTAVWDGKEVKIYKVWSDGHVQRD